MDKGKGRARDCVPPFTAPSSVYTSPHLRPQATRALTTIEASSNLAVERSCELPKASHLSLEQRHSLFDSRAKDVPTAVQSRIKRPLLLGRVTDTVVQALAMPVTHSICNDHSAMTPSSWTDAFEPTLLRLWDALYVRTVNSKRLRQEDTAVKDMIAYMKRKLVRAHPELGEGEITLGGQWIRYVLAKNLRHPFHEPTQPSRWELLSTAAMAGGARAGWGPW